MNVALLNEKSIVVGFAEVQESTGSNQVEIADGVKVKRGWKHENGVFTQLPIFAKVVDGIVNNIARMESPLDETWYEIPTGFPIKRGDKFNGINFSKREVPLEEVKEEKLESLESFYRGLLYTNVEAGFPSGVKVIQYRNQTDHINFTAAHQAATAMVALGNGENPIQFTTEDNIAQSVTAAEFADIGNRLFEEKQKLFYIYKTFKDTISVATTVEELDAIDLVTGWPGT